ncbi:GNAT family N-acetyltransferase [Nocardioides litoris]|uniref:GNAT family N-acetyltransferase n=1 Tax=Nocardioides litoris TaxID=1926648 RepID=UPI001120FED4|nr:GNAT family N-acetyltransferase [Nocardioides litoris]
MSGPTSEAVAAACAAWTWYPADATVVTTADLLLVRWPTYYEAPPTALTVDPAADVGPALDEALDQAREWGGEELLVWVRLDSPATLEDELRRRGGRLEETVDVLALDLDAPAPDLDVPGDVRVVWQTDVPTTRAVIEIGMAAFEEGSVPDDETLEALADEARADLAAGRGGSALALVDDRPVATGGLSLFDGVARLWGGGVFPGARGRGAYRAVLDARLRRARAEGATMALVKGRVDSSGPTLRRTGFTGFGQERSYVLST